MQNYNKKGEVYRAFFVTKGAFFVFSAFFCPYFMIYC